ncbi:MAG: SMC-Scp complex subunit ScpB [Oscillospiraceae bacterium]|nr:SMC-Scp complex subunit ScpB [Oscillospiraceae bacterium]
MKVEYNEKLSALEAILFALGEPVEDEKLALSAGIEQGELDSFINLLNDRYSELGSALEVIKLDSSRQLVTKKEFAPYISAAVRSKRSSALSQAALEVLTIVAYNQPVTRSFIDDVRGVDSSGVVNNLLEKELIAEAGRLDIPGKPVLFKTTENFLRCFGISNLGELPPLPADEGQISIDEIENEPEE